MGLDERDAELAREPGVLPVGRVVLAVGEHDGQRGAVAAGGLRGGGAQGVGQQVDLAVERARGGVRGDGDVLEQGAARGVQVGEAARRAHVVLEHEPLAVAVADEVQAGDADPDPARRLDAVHLRLVVVGRADHVGRHDAFGDDPLVAVDVGHERVERSDALRQAALDRLPVGGGDHARHGIDVELEVALHRGEAHAGALERAADLARQLRWPGLRDRLERRARAGPRGPVRREALVENPLARRVAGEQVVAASGPSATA